MLLPHFTQLTAARFVLLTAAAMSERTDAASRTRAGPGVGREAVGAVVRDIAFPADVPVAVKVS